jgi:hypothetical protein
MLKQRLAAAAWLLLLQWLVTHAAVARYPPAFLTEGVCGYSLVRVTGRSPTVIRSPSFGTEQGEQSSFPFQAITTFGALAPLLLSTRYLMKPKDSYGREQEA